MKHMTKYEFSLILKGPLELTEEIADQLFASGCDDGTPAMYEGTFSIDFHRKAASLETAVRTAIDNVRATGIEVERVELQPEALSPVG